MTLSILPTVSELDMNQLYHVYRSARDDAKGAMPERRTFTTGISIRCPGQSLGQAGRFGVLEVEVEVFSVDQGTSLPSITMC
jgi:hypothetical protein